MNEEKKSSFFFTKPSEILDEVKNLQITVDEFLESSVSWDCLFAINELAVDVHKQGHVILAAKLFYYAANKGDETARGNYEKIYKKNHCCLRFSSIK